MSISGHSWCPEMDNLITSDCDLVIIFSAPAIVYPNYNYYSYDQGRVFVVRVRPRQSGLSLKSYLHQIGTYCSTYNYWHKKYCSSEDECHDLALISFRTKCCENIKVLCCSYCFNMLVIMLQIYKNFWNYCLLISKNYK